MDSLTRRLLLILGLLGVVLAAGTIGFHVVEGWAWFDSFYMALITLTTVGFGELFPISTEGRVFASKTLEESGIRQNYGLIVLAIQKPEETMLFNPAPSTRIEVGDFLIAMGEASNLKRMETDFE